MTQKFFALFLLLVSSLMATQYNTTVLDLEAKLFPKMILMNENINKEAKNLHIIILSKDIDYQSANELKNYIQMYYPDRLMNKKVIVKIEAFKAFLKAPDALIVLHHEENELEQIAEWANKNSVISFAYDPSYMEYGLLGSLYIGKTTKPYLNREIIQKYNFRFSPYLLELSKFK